MYLPFSGNHQSRNNKDDLCFSSNKLTDHVSVFKQNQIDCKKKLKLFPTELHESVRANRWNTCLSLIKRLLPATD